MDERWVVLMGMGVCVLVLSASRGTAQCPDWAFYFGAEATEETLTVGSDTPLPIGMRNATASFAFQFGVALTQEGNNFVYEFSGTLGDDASRLVELLITDELGNSQTPVTPNTAVAPAPVSVARGSATEAFQNDDFFAVDMNPAVGGPGFTVGYVTDLEGDSNKIPTTADDPACPLNEIVIVTLSPAPAPQFGRGDATGDGRLDITDCVLIIQATIGNLPGRFDCDQALDTNDDGAATVTDALPPLSWLFQSGAGLPSPFLTCGSDPNPGDLGCAESSPFCAGNPPAGPLPPDDRPCPDWGFFFGPDASDRDFQGDSEIPITLRNREPVLGFQIGVQTTDGGLRFSGGLGTDTNRLIELLVTDDRATSRIPVAGNEAVGVGDVISVERGAALAGFSGDDFLSLDLSPGVGGPGFTVGYVADLDGDLNRIPPTPPGVREDCPVNEVLVVRVAGVPGGRQLPGDCNQDGALDISDPICILLVLFRGTRVADLPPGEFACGDGSATDAANRALLDFDGDDTPSVNLGDAIAALSFLFFGGPPHVRGRDCTPIDGCPDNLDCP